MLPDETTRRAIEDRLFGGGTIGTVEWVPAAGGLSRAAVWRVRRGEASFALRRAPQPDTAPDRPANTADILRSVAAAGLGFVAAPCAGRWPYRDQAGGLWEAAPWMPGAPLSDCPRSERAIAASVAGLAAFHQALERLDRAPRGASTSLDTRLAALRERFDDAWTTPPSLVEAWPELAPIGERIAPAAETALRLCDRVATRAEPAQLVHGDARPEHFLMTGEALTGLIDFGAMRRNTPLADLARLAGELVPGDSHVRDYAVRSYEHAAQRPIDRGTVAALDLTNAVLSARNWLRWLTERPPEPDRVESIRRRLASIAARLAAR